MISVVIPIFNEEENLPVLLERTTNVLNSLGSGYELILVNDGSGDDTKK